MGTRLSRLIPNTVFIGLLAASASLLVVVADQGASTGVGPSAHAQGSGDSRALALSGPVPISLELVASGVSNPSGIVNAGDDSGRLFFVLQGGQIMVYDGTQVLPTAFLDISSLVSCCGEQGLLGLAFHPNYESNGYFYVDYTNSAGDTVVARYSVSGNPNIANPASAVQVLPVDQPDTNHNGGQIEFGPDGYLYIAMGDGGGSGDPDDNGQDLTTLLGKLLRIDVDGGSPYAIPPDNPFVNKPGLDEIWAWGTRNPWRFSFDRTTGDLFIADVGQGSWEEVDFQAAGSSGGQNYGWRLMEGAHCFNPPDNCNDGTLTLPILEYAHTNGNCSITGGYRYRGSQYPPLAGVYLYGDYCSGRIWGAGDDGSGNWTAFEFLDSPYRITTFGQDEQGELYLADRTGGAIYRLVVPLGTCAGRPVTIAGTAGDDVLTGTAGADVISGLDGNDTINGLGGNDVVCAGNGNDTVNGGDGADQLLGQVGADTLNGGNGKDRLNGGGGKDNLNGDAGNDTLLGYGGDDAMNGGTQTDTCNGGPDTASGVDTAVNCETVSGVP